MTVISSNTYLYPLNKSRTITFAENGCGMG
jgi:hypothetical protein